MSCYCCLLNLGCNGISVYVLCCSVSGSVCVVCLTVFVNCLVKQFAICLGVFVILLLNVMELFSVVGGALLDRPECVCCACDPSVRLDAPSICVACGFVCRKVSPHIRV